MSLRKLIAVLAIFTTLSIGVATPKPAQAVSTPVIVIGAIAAWAVFIVGCAWWIYRSHPTTETAPLMPMPPEQTLVRDQPSGDLHFAHKCAQGSGNLTLVCW